MGYRATNTSKGGQCYELTVYNQSSTNYTSWELDVTLGEAAVLTDYWDIFALMDQSNRLRVIPASGMQTLSAGQTRKGTACLMPAVTFTDLDATVKP